MFEVIHSDKNVNGPFSDEVSPAYREFLEKRTLNYLRFFMLHVNKLLIEGKQRTVKMAGLA